MATRKMTRSIVLVSLAAFLKVCLNGETAEPKRSRALRFDFSHYELGKAELKTFLISATQAPPVIDGQLGEALWQRRPALRVVDGGGGGRRGVPAARRGAGGDALPPARTPAGPAGRLYPR